MREREGERVGGRVGREGEDGRLGEGGRDEGGGGGRVGRNTLVTHYPESNTDIFPGATTMLWPTTRLSGLGSLINVSTTHRSRDNTQSWLQNWPLS